MLHTQMLVGSSKLGGLRSVAKGGVESLRCALARRRALCGCLGSGRSVAISGRGSLQGALVHRYKPSRSIIAHGTVAALGLASTGEPNPSFKRTSTGVPVYAA